MLWRGGCCRATVLVSSSGGARGATAAAFAVRGTLRCRRSRSARAGVRSRRARSARQCSGACCERVVSAAGRAGPVLATLRSTRACWTPFGQPPRDCSATGTTERPGPVPRGRRDLRHWRRSLGVARSGALTDGRLRLAVGARRRIVWAHVLARCACAGGPRSTRPGAAGPETGPRSDTRSVGGVLRASAHAGDPSAPRRACGSSRSSRSSTTRRRRTAPCLPARRTREVPLRADVEAE